MRSTMQLNEIIEKVKSKLLAEGIDLLNYNACIECLSKTVAPNICIEIYENYIIHIVRRHLN